MIWRSYEKSFLHYKTLSMPLLTSTVEKALWKNIIPKLIIKVYVVLYTQEGQP